MLVNDAQTTFVKFVDDQSTRKSMKSVSIMIVQKIIVMSDTKHFNKILLNENAEINVISYRYAIAHDMTSIDNDFSISSHVKKKSMHCYDAYNVRIWLVDSWKQKRVFETMFYVLNKNEMSDMIFELSELKQIETKLNYQMLIWRYDFSEQTLKISSTNDFAKKINHHDFIYVVMIQSYKSDTRIKINAVSTFVENVDDSAKKISFEFRKFDDVFSLKNEKILASHKENVDHAIELKNDKQSSYESLYNLFNFELKTLRLYLDDALTRDIIKHSMSSIEASVLFVLKKNEKLRLCVDYRDLNKIIRKNRHSLSLIIQMLNQLKDCRFFIKIDLTDAYNRIRIKKNDEWKTTFRTRYEHFEYLMMFFDLANASITFQIYINKILNELINDFCVMYLNDILIFFKNRESHVQHIREVLKRLRTNDLFANLEKCFFFKHEVDYLEFIISEDDITMNSSRINIIMSWSMIKFFKNIQIFLNFVNFYRRFIARFFQLSALLSDMLKKMQARIKKKSFLLTKKARQTFDLLRDVFQYALILTHFDSEFLIKLKTNAFDYEIVDIISQLQSNEQWRFVAFFSRKMIFAEMNYETHDQELLIIVECFKHWRHYLKKNYHTMKVFIDHNNLKDFMNVKTLNERQIKWTMRLINFDFIIKHRFEKINFVDDSSRRSDYHDVNTKITRLLFILQTKLRIVVSLHIQFSSVRATIVALSAKISRIVSNESEISRSEVATFASISVLSEKRRECDELAQCVLRAIIAILSENEIFYENNFEFILNLIKTL